MLNPLSCLLTKAGGAILALSELEATLQVESMLSLLDLMSGEIEFCKEEISYSKSILYGLSLNLN